MVLRCIHFCSSNTSYAVSVGFEPTERSSRSPDFKSGALNQLCQLTIMRRGRVTIPIHTSMDDEFSKLSLLLADYSLQWGIVLDLHQRPSGPQPDALLPELTTPYTLPSSHLTEYISKHYNLKDWCLKIHCCKYSFTNDFLNVITTCSTGLKIV